MKKQRDDTKASRIGGEEAQYLAMKPKAEEWVAQHGEPSDDAERNAMYEQTEVDWKLFAEWRDKFEASIPSGSRLNVIDLGTLTAPPPPQSFVVDGYIPEGFVTSLFAKGGSSKSFLAMFIAFHVVLGRPFLDRAVKRGPVLFVDAELDSETAQRRAFMIARGMELDRPPLGVHHVPLQSPLSNEDCHRRVSEEIRRLKPRLVIVDSFTAALRGTDTNSLDDVTERHEWLTKLGATVLVIDHTSKGLDIAGDVSATGSVAKHIFVRSALFIASNGKASILKHVKSNFGRLAEPVSYALNFSEDSVTLESPLPDDDPRLTDIERALSVPERTKRLLESDEYGGGLSAEEIAETLCVSPGTVRNALTSLKREGIATSSSGKWRASIHSHHTPRENDVNEDSGPTRNRNRKKAKNHKFTVVSEPEASATERESASAEIDALLAAFSE